MSPVNHTKQQKSSHKTRLHGLPMKLLITGGLILMVAATLFLKNGQEVQTAIVPDSDQSLEVRLNGAIQRQEAIFIFLHSLECIPCKEMMEVVAQVYPEFREQVALIDVDVYDPQNTNILRREGLQAIPTLVFYDQQGERQMHVGVLQPDQLRVVLQEISGED
ncbi:MAG: thioredoxin domain-containing protein [Anaerolineales bacterium]|nr:thioredoxin domain-containing protein [Anaerolineales bacterium]